jgi:hypothetical protein
MLEKRRANYTPAMIFALLTAATVWFVALLFVMVLARRAPIGFEGEEGFHVVDDARPSDRRGHEATHGIFAQRIFGS